MSEKLKPNFTPIPNVVFEKLMPRLSKAALKVLLAVARKTYGWGKERDAISFTQLQRMTELGRSGVARGIRELDSLILVTRVPEHNCNEYELNIDVPTSELVFKMELVSKWNEFHYRQKASSKMKHTKQRRQKK
jgi:phage replication O-like protein O